MKDCEESPNLMFLDLESKQQKLKEERWTIHKQRKKKDLDEKLNNLDYKINAIKGYINQTEFRRYYWDMGNFERVLHGEETNLYVELREYFLKKDLMKTVYQSPVLTDPQYPDELCQKAIEYLETRKKLDGVLCSSAIIQKREEEITRFKE